MRISTNQIYQTGVTNMSTQQERMLQLYNQLSTGLKVQTAADNPVAGAQIELMQQRLGSVQLMQQNNQNITSSLNLQEGVLSDAISTVQNLMELQNQAGNGLLSQSDRKSLADAVQNALNQLQQQANSTDANGNYMFAGSKSNIAPVTQVYNSSTGTYTYNYNGDSNQRFQGISDNIQVATNDTGDNLFMRIPAGNGSFSISQPSTPNTGTASVSPGSLIDPSAFVPGDYTMSFGIGGSGSLEVTVTNTATGATAYNAPYQSGGTVGFNGMQMVVTGAPNSGDSFSINTSKNESVFATAQRMINNLNAPDNGPVSKAVYDTENSQLMMQLSSALDNLSRYRSELGGRLNQLQTVSDTNANLQAISEDTLKSLREADPVAVATQYNLQLVNLQAAQQSFVKIQSLSVFNYI